MRRLFERRVGGRLRHWHATAGICAALFLLLLLGTGLALNHTQALRLDSRPVNAPWLMRWYGLHASMPSTGYALGSEYLAWDAQRWVLGAKLLGEKLPQPVGAVSVADTHYIASRGALFLYTREGRLIDRLEKDSLPGAPIERLGRADDEVVLQTAQGVFATNDGLNWRTFSGAVPGWSLPEPLPEAIRQGLAAAFAPSLPLERVLLDLHSGRLFGRYGPLVVDVVALLLGALALSGTWIYIRSARRRAQANR
jgi:PepSY-associated TM region